MKPTVLTVTLNPSLDKTIVLDRLQPGMLNRAQEVRQDPGGKAINVARLLHDYDISVLALPAYMAEPKARNYSQIRQTGLAVQILANRRAHQNQFENCRHFGAVRAEINEQGAK